MTADPRNRALQPISLGLLSQFPPLVVQLNFPRRNMTQNQPIWVLPMTLQRVLGQSTEQSDHLTRNEHESLDI